MASVTSIQTFGGEHLLPGEDAFDRHRVVSNGLIDRRPAAPRPRTSYPLEVRTERWCGLAGLGFIVIIVPAIVTESVGPNVGMSPSSMAAAFASTQTDVLLGSMLLLAAQVALLLFAVGVATLAHDQRALSTLVVVSAAIGIAGLSVYVTIFASIASSIHQLHNNDVIYGLFTVATSMDNASGTFGGLMFLAAARALRLSNLSGLWLTRLGLVAGALVVLSALAIVNPRSFWLSAPGLIGTLLSLVWILITSVQLLRVPLSAMPSTQNA